ncbi:hypothetical protein LIER_04916 [Lithospermum erythrorhizon]
MIYPQRQRATIRLNPERKRDRPWKPKDLGCKTSDIKLPSRNKKVWRPKEKGNKNMTFHITVEEGETQLEDAIDAPPGLEEYINATVDELKEINLGTTEDPRPTYVSALLTPEEEAEYVSPLIEFRDVFAWTYSEMPGLNPKVVVHHLAVKKGSRPVKKGQRRFHPELVPSIEAEVNRLIDTGFIREVVYPTWLTNIVPLRKKNG